MGKRTIILTEKQLHEILGTNMSYLDNTDNDFKQNGSNEVFTGDKTDTNDAEPLTGDKYGRERVVNYGPWMPGGRNGIVRAEYGYRNGVNESNSELEGTMITIDNDDQGGKMSYTAATTKKNEMEQLKDRAEKGDMKALQQFNNRGGEDALKKTDNALKNKTGIVKRAKENKKNLGMDNAFQKPGGKKNSGNGKAHTKKNGNGFLYYFENKI